MYAIRPCLDSCLFVLNHELISNKIHLFPSDKAGNCIYEVNVTCNNMKTIILFALFGRLL